MPLSRLPVSFRSDQYALREFQEDAIQFISKNRRSLVMLGVGAGKTLITLSLHAFLNEMRSTFKTVYVTEYVSVRQVDTDLQKFFKGKKATTIFEKTLTERVKIYRGFLVSDSEVLVLNYQMLISAFGKKHTKIKEENKHLLEEEKYLLSEILHHPDLLLVIDEATNIANPKSLAYGVISQVSKKVARTVALTATPVWKNLLSVFNIMRGIGLPVMDESEFKRKYCSYRPKVLTKKDKNGKEFVLKKKNPKTGELEEMVRNEFIGHKNVDAFWKEVERFTFIKMLDIDLPIRVVKYDLPLSAEMKKAQKILKGFYKFRPYNVVQITLNSPSFIKKQFDEAGIDDGHIEEYGSWKSTKFDWFKAKIEELSDQKILLYSPYTTVINDFIERSGLLSEQYAKITGDNESTTEEEKSRFINNPNCNLMFLTDAGSKGVDGLQISGHLLFPSPPLGASKYMQIIGRLRRIGSAHSGILVHMPIIYNSTDEDLYKIIQSELRLIKQVNPLQILDESLIDPSYDNMKTITFDGEGGMVEWLKVQIQNRKY